MWLVWLKSMAVLVIMESMAVKKGAHFKVSINHPVDTITQCIWSWIIILFKTNQPDFNFQQFEHQLSPEIYNANLLTIMNSLAQGDYECNWKNTGISKPSILSGLLSSYMLKIPLCFTVNLMHLICLNVLELLISLWWGTIQCEATNSKQDWDWASQLMDNNIWQAHGKLVASVTKYFPSFFHCPPWNPAEKISSGYKATKYYLYIFGLGPGFFWTVLPKKYWRNFCKLVHAVHIIMEHSISGKQTQEAYLFFVQFVEEYENIYYQWCVDWLHFTQPCLHSPLHTPPEVFCVGNGIHTDQFTMEHAIGELGKKIQQPSNPYGALAQLALWKAQINAIKVICPEPAIMI